ncbi:histidine phosphatase family protein [Allobranchiibius sp. GilTou38]|uniref:histidine phosphatase family protein n=1 Tax=Allobranchiibius sp. GilTou38 TaxID=2815210 RepID=UPI001AA10740|nr:histidine phosphatase family protein [Allobranchiibius sp. GilTou38]MBO1765242.1 histidine phosphatase family protein [Allobranchiibius sp. GilTou38]
MSTTAGGESAGSRAAEAVPPRRIIVLRHGQTTFNAAGIWQGRLDAPLSDLGRRQAQDAAAALAAYDIEVIYTSDLSRALDTARALGAAVGIDPVCDARLREIDVGEWAGMTTTEVTEQFPDEQAAITAGDDLRRGRTGESVAHVATRVDAFIEDVVSTLPPGATMAVVSHGVTGRALAAQLVGMQQGVAWHCLGGLFNCHWAQLVEHRSGWRIERWNADR